jgi:cysteine synthase
MKNTLQTLQLQDFGKAINERPLIRPTGTAKKHCTFAIVKLKTGKDALKANHGSLDAFITAPTHGNPNIVLAQVPDSHSRTIAEDIWRDTNGQVDYVVTAVGADGVLAGMAGAMKRLKPEIKAIAVEPIKPLIIFKGEGDLFQRKRVATDSMTIDFNKRFFDETFELNPDDFSQPSNEVTQLEGIRIPSSSAGIIWVALQIAKRRGNEGKTIVAVVPLLSERKGSLGQFGRINSHAEHLDSFKN